MKPFAIIIIAFTLLPWCALGQTGISGRVVDGNQNLPWVTVVLLGADSTFVAGVVTDSVGSFSFMRVQPGIYKVSASMIGYKKYLSDKIQVTEKDVRLADILLAESSTQLEDVLIKESRQLIDQKIDRLVINLGSSITSAGNSVLEVLQKSPGVMVNRQSNTITINGRSGVTVMINNKPLQVPLDVVLQMLDGMNASNLERIELITAPPSEFDAEGNAGIIHLVTKQQEDLGTNGSVGLVAGARWAEAFGANVNISHRNKRLAAFADYSIVTNHNLHIYKSDSRSRNNEVMHRVYGYSHRENFTVQQNLSAGVEWMVDRNSSLNLSVTGYRRNWDLDARTDDMNQIGADSTAITNMDLEEKNLWQSAATSVGFQTKLSAKSELNLSVDYLYYLNDNPSSYHNNVYSDAGGIADESTIELSKTTPIRFLITRADYAYKLPSSVSLEAGVKAVASTLDNNVLARRNEDDVWVVDPLFTSFSTLVERIYAGYFSTKWHPDARWQINGGLRYEYTQTEVSTPTQSALIDRRYGYFFPSFSAKRTLGTERDFQVSYTKRITRPTYNDIAPYVFFWGPRTFSAGNTALYPAVADAFSASYHVRNAIITLQFSHSRREIVMMQPEVDADHNTLTYRSQNLEYLKTLSLTKSYTLAVTPWWELQSNVTAQFQTVRTAHLISNITRRLYGISLNVINQFKLPNNFSLEISGTYQSKTLLGVSEFLPTGSLNAGIQKNLGRQGVVRLAMDDILNTNYWRIKTASTSELNSYFNYKWHNRFIRISYTRNLGKNSLRSIKAKSGSEEERNRVAN